MSAPSCSRDEKRCAQDSRNNNNRTGCCAGRPKSSCAKSPCMASPIVPAPPVDANPCKKETSPCCPAKKAPSPCCPPARSDNCPPSRGGCCCKATVRLDPCCTAVKKPLTDSCQRSAANDCMNCDLTDFGKQHAANTGKLIQNCICVKFNGLQDFCTHSSCNGSARKGCTDNPFPSCLPAQKWKCDFICKDRKKPDGC